MVGMVMTYQNDIYLRQFTNFAGWRSIPFLFIFLGKNRVDQETIFPKLNNSCGMTYPGIFNMRFWWRCEVSGDHW